MCMRTYRDPMVPCVLSPESLVGHCPLVHQCEWHIFTRAICRRIVTCTYIIMNFRPGIAAVVNVVTLLLLVCVSRCVRSHWRWLISTWCSRHTTLKIWNDAAWDTEEKRTASHSCYTSQHASQTLALRSTPYSAWNMVARYLLRWILGHCDRV